ncbi:chondroitinase-B domain-containing protein [Vibrio rarus]|uniref:chondroitinase-B domain-containing protein n=1 Tax=Vibrio rarus TaxID=413403 RepID=UPI0021C264E4|nr:chondroitinase-B domain-containing protein [Vibrio rarus]
MNKHALAILIGLALVGCNSKSNDNPATQKSLNTSENVSQQTQIPSSTATPSTAPEKSNESISATVLTPSTKVATKNAAPQTQAPSNTATPSTTPAKSNESISATVLKPSTKVAVTQPSQPPSTNVTPPLTASDLKSAENIFKSSGIPEGVTQIPAVNCTQTFDSIEGLTDKAKELTKAADNAAEEAAKQGTTATNINANTTLCLDDGEYSSSEVDLRINGFKVAAKNSGKAIIKNNEVQVTLSGRDSVLQGLVFDGVTYGSQLISTRGHSNEVCQHCRITEVAVVNPKPAKKSGILVKIYGGDIWFDHSILSGKVNANPMISLVREKRLSQEQLAHNVVVYKNYIANRPPVDGKIYPDSGDNDYEAIRTGLSETHEKSSHSFVVANLFENIQGEAEVISNKASDNTISFNTIRSSYGSLTNRHGHNSKIENNFILGEGYPQSGGIRIVDHGHQVNNNYIESARYLSSTHHGGIVLLGSDGAGDGDNGYQQVEDVHITNNTIVDSVNSFNLDGGGKKTQPRNVFIENNIVDKAVGPVFKSSKRGLPPSSEILGNIFSGQKVADSDKITAAQLSSNEFASAGLQRDSKDNLYRPTDQSPSLTATITADNKGEITTPSIDMDGQLRNSPATIGADEISTAEHVLKPLTYQDVGPLSYKLAKPEPIMVVATIENSNFEQGINGWQGHGAQTITGTQAFSGQTVQLSDNGSLSQEITVLPNHHYVMSAFVQGHYELAIDGITSAKGDVTSDQYKWVRVPFDSGANNTVSVSLKIPTTVTVKAAIANPAIDKSDVSDWITHEDSDAGLGDVTVSSDSAFSGTGSMRIRFKKTADANNDFSAEPGVSQIVKNLPKHTDMTFSVYYCDKMKDNSLANLHFGAKTVTSESLKGNTINDKYVNNKDLTNAPKGSSKDCFKQASTTFNTGDNDQVELFATMAVDKDAIAKDQVRSDQYYNNSSESKFEIRVDNFALQYEGKANDGLTGNVDEVRVATRNDQ